VPSKLRYAGNNCREMFSHEINVSHSSSEKDSALNPPYINENAGIGEINCHVNIPEPIR
jgi:hypothetical protein